MRQVLKQYSVAKWIWLVLGLTLASSLSAAKTHLKIVYAHGSGTSSLTSVTENEDGTISLEAAQAGHLSHFGEFTGMFRYTAYIDPVTWSTLLLGEGELVNDKGETIFLALEVFEPEPDYPKTFTGTMRITGGTGRFANAFGALLLTGVDEESPEDAFSLNGLIITRS